VIHIAVPDPLAIIRDGPVGGSLKGLKGGRGKERTMGWEHSLGEDKG